MCHYDFESCGYAYSNLMADAHDWAVIVRLDKEEHLWRVSYGERSDLSEEQRLERIAGRFKHFMPQATPVAPRPRQFLSRASTFGVHGTVPAASSWPEMRRTRPIPLGGLGLTSGIQDASTLIQVPRRLSSRARRQTTSWTGMLYERRGCFLEVVNPSATEFKRRAQGDRCDSSPGGRSEAFARCRTIVKPCGQR